MPHSVDSRSVGCPLRIEVAESLPSADSSADILLLAGRAAFLPATATLLVADLHLGKAATFRSAGIPIPEGSAQRDLARLERLVDETAARRLIVLGDLFHARSGCTAKVFDEFAAMRARIAAAEVILVAGNHDRVIGKIPSFLGIDSCMRTHDEPPFHFVHEPSTGLSEPDRECFTVAGHLHPTLSITAPGGGRIAGRCFVAGESLLVLPAFGSFTGGHRVAAADGQRLWLARDDGVADVTRLAMLAAKSRR
jgi:DNA ligase-associated metallophosphoesterase